MGYPDVPTLSLTNSPMLVLPFACKEGLSFGMDFPFIHYPGIGDKLTVLSNFQNDQGDNFVEE